MLELPGEELDLDIDMGMGLGMAMKDLNEEEAFTLTDCSRYGWSEDLNSSGSHFTAGCAINPETALQQKVAALKMDDTEPEIAEEYVSGRLQPHLSWNGLLSAVSVPVPVPSPFPQCAVLSPPPPVLKGKSIFSYLEEASQTSGTS